MGDEVNIVWFFSGVDDNGVGFLRDSVGEEDSDNDTWFLRGGVGDGIGDMNSGFLRDGVGEGDACV